MLIYTPYKLAIGALIASLILTYLSRYIVDHISYRNKHLTIICGTPFVLAVVSFVSAVYFVLGATHQVPLSEFYYLMERDFAIGILVALLIGCCWYGFSEYDKSASERTSVGPISLSQVSDKVHVDGSKVIIDELPKNIVYAFDGTNGRKVFEYSYDEKYEIGKLKTASGSTLELTHKDTELLRSLGAK